jgi:ketosteroid isomerase-like protein
MKRTLIAFALPLLGAAWPAIGQQASSADEEMMKTRQAMADKYALAIARKDISATATDLYTADAIIQSLCPESPRAFGPEAYTKRLEAALKSGFGDYVAKVKEAHVLGDGRAWTTGSYTSTVNDKEGKPEQARGNWIDMLRRDGNEWKVSFQAYARTPC